MRPYLAAAAFLVAITASNAMAQPGPAAPPAPPAAPASPADWARYPNAAEVELRSVAGFVLITPQDREDVALMVINPGSLPAPRIRRVRNRLIIDGNLRRSIRSCVVGDDAELDVQIERIGRVPASQLPTYELRVPRDAVVAAEGAVRLVMQRANSANVRLSGCGDAEIMGVVDAADVGVAGVASLRMYDAGSAEVALAGRGDVILGAIRDGLAVSIAGPGALTATRVDGATSVALQGSGDIHIRGGRAAPLSVVIAGSGNVIHDGDVTQLDAVIVGSGDVRVRRVDGEISRTILGSGEVVVQPR